MKPSLLIPALALAGAIVAGCPDTGIICNSPDTLCGPSCANLLVDPANCGVCGEACATGFVCQSGACLCDPKLGLTACGQACVDVRSSASNCGGCGTACGLNQLCEALDAGGGNSTPATCVVSCSAGNSDCNGGCVDVATDRLNCGACGNACIQGTACVEGVCLPGLEVACFNSGQLYAVDSQAEVVGAMPASGPPYNPIAVAGLGANQSLVADFETSSLYTFGTAASGTFQLAATDSIGHGANSVVVQGATAYVVNSNDHSLSIVDTTKALDAGRVSTVVIPFDQSFPQYVAVTPDGAYAYVTLQGNTLDSGVSDSGGNAVATIDLLTKTFVGLTGIPYQLDAGYEPRPQGIAIVNGKVFVALANLTGYEPGAPSTVDVFSSSVDGGGGLDLIQQDIALGENCVNAGQVFPLGNTLFVACGPQYNSDFTSVAKPGALAGINLNTLSQAFAAQPFSCADSSCSPGGALRMAYAAGKLFIGDSIDGRLFTADPTTGAILRGPDNAIIICPVNDGGANFISDLAVP